MLDTSSPEASDNGVTTRPAKTRRSYPRELKASIVAECIEGSRSVASVALEHGINANLVHKWIRHCREDPTPRMLPVISPAVNNSSGDCGHIELSLPGTTIRLFGTVEEGNIRALLRALQ